MSSSPPVIIEPLARPSLPEHGAVFIFLHGLGDDAHGWENIAEQFQSAKKLPHLRWIFANAPENRDAMQQAWYTPTRLTPFPSSRPELDDEEDEDGLKKSAAYVDSLVDGLIARGLPPHRIVLGGYSQGGAVTLLAGLTSKYAGKLAGLVCLSGYMPLIDKIQRLRSMGGHPATVGEVPIFVARGTKDMLVPKRYLTMCVDKLRELDVSESALEVHEYQDMGHTVSGEELRHLCQFLEKIVPALED